MPQEFHWITSESLARQRGAEELAKRGEGDRKIIFEVPLYWVQEFDVFSDFQLQDPYEIGATELLWASGRYYFIETINYDFDGDKLVITAIDLEWLMSQYMIFGDEDELTDNWEDAPNSDKKYFYACDEVTGKFANGESGKIAGSEEE